MRPLIRDMITAQAEPNDAAKTSWVVSTTPSEGVSRLLTTSGNWVEVGYIFQIKPEYLEFPTELIAQKALTEAMRAVIRDMLPKVGL